VGREGGEKRGRKGLIIDGVLQGRMCSVVWCGLHAVGSYREASGAELDWIIIRLGFGLPCSAVLGFAS
jgi:hypothetical protein